MEHKARHKVLDTNLIAREEILAVTMVSGKNVFYEQQKNLK